MRADNCGLSLLPAPTFNNLVCKTTSVFPSTIFYASCKVFAHRLGEMFSVNEIFLCNVQALCTSVEIWLYLLCITIFSTPEGSKYFWIDSFGRSRSFLVKISCVYGMLSKLSSWVFSPYFLSCYESIFTTALQGVTWRMAIIKSQTGTLMANSVRDISDWN